MKGLKPDTAYVFRVRAQNLTGVGNPSTTLGPVLAQTRAGECHFNMHVIFLPHFPMRKHSVTIAPLLLPFSGTKEMYVDVDDDGVISMVFECSEMTEGSEFIWSKNYQAITDTSRVTIVTEDGK